MAFHVYVERPQSSEPGAVEALAEAIAARYRVGADAVARRLASGRFAVRTGVELEAATRLAADLERIGAVCSVVGDDGAEVSSGASAAPDYRSGLAAAYASGGSGEAVRLGALDEADPASASGSLRLSTLDGEEEPARPEPPPASFAPEAPPEPAPELAASSPPPAGADAWAGADPFAPPPSDEEELELASGGGSARPAAPPDPLARGTPGVEPSPGPAAGAPAGAAPSRGAAREALDSARSELAARPRLRFAAGVLLAVLLGFVPAHFVSAMREGAAFGAVDDELEATYAQLVEPEESEVEALWDSALEQKRSARTNIAITGCFLWLAVGGGFAFLWFRKIDWTA